MKRNANAYYDLVKGAVEAFNERIQYDKLTEDGDYQDALHEVVDVMVPHYYHEIFTVMAADGISHEFDDAGLMPDTKDVTKILQARIYEALYNDVQADTGLVWFEEEEEEEEATEWYVISDMTTGANILARYESLDEAIESCKEKYALGTPCHVEDDTSSENLFDPESYTGTNAGSGIE